MQFIKSVLLMLMLVVMPTSGLAQNTSPNSDALNDLKPYLLALSVSDVEATTKWYQEMLGFVVTKRINLPERALRIVFLELNGFKLELVENKKSFSIKKHVPAYDESSGLLQGVAKFAFLTNDIEAVAARLKKREVRVVLEMRENKEARTKSFMIADNNGNLIQFFQKLG